jgi:hypothetical protein
MQKPVSGKWYLIQPFKVGRGPRDRHEVEKMVAHNQGVSQMVLAGPFDSHDAALAMKKDFEKDSMAWQCP